MRPTTKSQTRPRPRRSTTWYEEEARTPAAQAARAVP
jgi:hypothetical protein